MSKHHIRLLLCSAASVALIAGALFVVEWFHMRLGAATVEIDLRNVRACAPEGCRTFGVSSAMGSMYTLLAAIAFWGGLLLALMVVVQAAFRVVADHASTTLVRGSYGLGSAVFLSAFCAGWLFSPDEGAPGSKELFAIMMIDVERTGAVWMMLGGSLLAMIAIRYAALASDADDVGEYKPVVIEKRDDARVPVTPLNVNAAQRTKSPSDSPQRTKAPSDPPGRARAPTQPPPGSGTSIALGRTRTPSQQIERTRTPSQQIERTKPPSQQLATRARSPSQPDAPSSVTLEKARTSSSGPIDLAARLGAAPVEVAIKPPKPEPVAVPPDQIPVAPESGLVIRKRTPSSAPPASHPARPKPLSYGPPLMPTVDHDLGDLAFALGAGPSALRGKIKYALATATFTSAGIAAHREDGVKKLVPWDSIVGLIARRLPNEGPYAGTPFVDVVSTAGATLRFLPWSKIDGAPVLGEGEERARSFVQLLAARCLEAKLDSWTKVFADGAGRAAQLPSLEQLAAHDERLA